MQKQTNQTELALYITNFNRTGLEEKTHIDQTKAKRCKETLQRRVTGLRKDRGRVKRHDVDAGELLCRHDNGGTERGTTEARHHEELLSTAQKCAAAKGFIFFLNLAMGVVLVMREGMSAMYRFYGAEEERGGGIKNRRTRSLAAMTSVLRRQQKELKESLWRDFLSSQRGDSRLCVSY